MSAAPSDVRITRSFTVQVPLESLSSELDAYLSVLRNRLLEVINEHYADFVSLSSRLVNVDTAVLHMQKPLLEIRVTLNVLAVQPLQKQLALCVSRSMPLTLPFEFDGPQCVCVHRASC